MTSAPNPAKTAEYQVRLADMIAARAVQTDLNNVHKVRNLNRQIQAQMKWIARSQASQAASG
jgi:hypothetical protein